MPVLAWETYQYNDKNIGYITEEIAEFNTSNIFTEITDGASFQPFIIDLDDDGNIEVVGSDGNYIKIWQITGGVLVLDDEWNLGISQTTMMDTIPNYDSDNYTEIIGVFGNTNVTIFEYNGTDFNIEASWNMSQNVVSVPVCINTTHSWQIGCWWATADGNLSETGYNASDEWDVGVSINFSNADIFTTQRGKYNSPAVSDIDRDGADEIIFHCDYDDDGNEGICVFDVSGVTFDSYFSADGVIDDLTTDASKIAGITIYNLDDAGDEEIIVTHYSAGGIFSSQDSDINVYKANGDSFWSAEVFDDGNSDGITKISMPVVADFIDTTFDDSEDICMVSVYSFTAAPANEQSRIRCYDDDGDSIFTYTTPQSADNDKLYWWEGGTIAGMEAYDNDGAAKIELIIGGAILVLESNIIEEHINFTTLSATEAASSIAIGDLQNDNSGDICGQRGGNVFCSYMTIINNPPTLTEFNINTGNPVCVGETITISATENTDYTNDHSFDTERVRVLYPNSTVEYGDFANAYVTKSIIAPEAGTYNIYLYLQDNANDEDLTQYTIYTLITSANNETCKESGENPTTSSSSATTPTTERDDVEGFLCSFIQGFGLTCGGYATTIIWLIGMVGLFFSMVSAKMEEMWLHVAAQGFMIILGGLLGAVNPWVAFLIGFIIAGIAVITIFSPRNTGGI